LLYSLGWSWTCDPLALASWMWGIQVCSITPSLFDTC
jgi:hypothetical protein